MKLCLTILLIIFISIEAHGSRVKRGLSADEQKKFLEELNKDRKKIAEEVGFKFVPMKYNASLENKIVSGKNCLNHQLQMPLRLNDGAEKMRKHHMSTSEGNIYSPYFNANFDKIGCSKEAKCAEVLTEKNGPPELEGTTIEYYGMCVLGNREYGVNYDPDRLQKAEAPSPNKYADILGVVAGNQESTVEDSGKNGADAEQGSGAGSVFSLIISLFMVLYI